MTKTENLDSLFIKWESSVKGYKGKMKRDGIVNESLYLDANPKVLFITKEPNDPRQSSGDYRTWWKEGLKYSFSNRIAELSFGLHNSFPKYDLIKGNYTELRMLRFFVFIICTINVL